MKFVMAALIALVAGPLSQARTPAAAIPTGVTLAELVVQDDVTPVDFSKLNDFEWEAGKVLPESVTKLKGKKIGIVGFMRAEDLDGLTTFWLIDQNCDCEGQPKMTEVILCTLPEGVEVDNDDTPVRVVGTFDCGEERDGEYVTSVYRLSIEKIE